MAKPIHVRIEEDLQKDFAEVLELTGMGETQFVKASIRALIEYVREHGEIRLPLAIVPKSELKQKLRTPATTQLPARGSAPIVPHMDPPTASTRALDTEAASRTSDPSPAEIAKVPARRNAPPVSYRRKKGKP